MLKLSCAQLPMRYGSVYVTHREPDENSNYPMKKSIAFQGSHIRCPLVSSAELTNPLLIDSKDYSSAPQRCPLYIQ